MAEVNDFKGCKVIIHDEQTQETIAETIIEDHNKTTYCINIDAAVLRNYDATKVSLLIFSDNGIIECMGTVRKKYMSSFTEIALYRTREKESRSARRYTVNARGMIENLVVDGRLSPLEVPIVVMVRNVSTSGALLRIKDQRLTIGDTFLLNLDIAGSNTAIVTSVLRETENQDGIRSLGCQFHSLLS